MKRFASKSTVHTFTSVFLAAGMMILPGTLQAEQGRNSHTPVGSDSDVSAPDVQSHPKSGFGNQITVIVKNGVATLIGGVENKEEIADAVENAYEAGAKRVKSELWVDPDLS